VITHAHRPLGTPPQVAQFILVLKDNGHGGTYFDCYDLGMVLGNMVKAGDATQAGQVGAAVS
jgi:hypothetical protein